MFKIIISNLWRRRRQNIWLFLELIIVTILTWVIADPTIVGIYDLYSDPGYDTERTVTIETAYVPSNSTMFDRDAWTIDRLKQDYETSVMRLKSLPEVENASRVNDNLGADSGIQIPIAAEWQLKDSIFNWIPLLYEYKNTDFFKIYGIEAVEGYPSIDEILSKPLGENDYIITESFNNYLSGEQAGLKDKYFLRFSDGGDHIDTIRVNVAGVVKDFHLNSYMRTNIIAIGMLDFQNADLQLPPKIVVRLKAGVDADQFAADRLEDISDMLRIGNLYVKSVSSQNSLISKTEAIRGVKSSRMMNILVASLFLVNLILGVVGCMWLQTGKRIKEVGVLRSYGAVRSNITGMLIGESVVMATVAVALGCLIYLQYALKQGLSSGVINNSVVLQQPSWISDFSSHLLIISAAVYALIIICVVIGTYFPARHVSRIEPVDALRDE